MLLYQIKLNILNGEVGLNSLKSLSKSSMVASQKHTTMFNII
jgi:hypothetical protein